MEKEEDIDQIFRSALEYRQKDHKNQRQYALFLGLTQDHLSKLLKADKPKNASDKLKRRIASKLGFPGRAFEEFLDIGRAIQAGKDPAGAGPKGGPDRLGAFVGSSLIDDDGGDLYDVVVADALRERGFIAVPFSDNMRLAASGGGTIGITEDINSTPVVVYGPALRRRSPKGLRAFRVGGDSMEPVIAEGGLVIADLADNDPDKLKEGKIYVLCWDLREGECAVKYLRWAEKGRSLLITSPDQNLHPPLVKPIRDVRLVGRVIWSWREH